MEKFSLDKWLQDKSRKVTTRLGNREVRIVCWDRKNNSNKPIITLMVDPEGNEYTTFHTKNGFVDEKEKYIDKRDLFFADEDEELSEFEKHVQAVMMNCALVGHTNSYKDIDAVKATSKHLLDLARKELQQEFKEEYNRGYSIGKFDAGEVKVKELVAEFEKGKQYALKSLPKWKKMPNGIQGNGDFSPTYLIRTSNGHYFTTPCLSWDKDSMYIELSELEKLPKEE